MTTSSPPQDVTLFTAVDRTKDPSFFARFLDAANAIAQPAKPLVLDALRLRPGHAVLDVGCGTGADVIEIAQIVGASGRSVGIDISEALIGQARERAAGSGVPVELLVGDAQELGFDEGTFDACRCERLLMHVPDAQGTIAEMVRVTRPGGRVVACDFDWDTLAVDSPDKETTRAVVRSFSDRIRHGWIGRQMPRLFRAHGLADVSVVAHQAFVQLDFFELLIGGHLVSSQEQRLLQPEAVESWWNGLRDASERGDFLATFTAFIVAGTKP